MAYLASMTTSHQVPCAVSVKVGAWRGGDRAIASASALALLVVWPTLGLGFSASVVCFDSFFHVDVYSVMDGWMDGWMAFGEGWWHVPPLAYVS